MSCPDNTQDVHIPPATKQPDAAGHYSRLGKDAITTGDSSEWTVVTDEAIPTDVDVGNAPVEVTPSRAAEVDAPLRSQETKEALLKWQREQFIQRAELTRALAQAQLHHIDESRNAASYMGLVSVLASIHATECSTLYVVPLSRSPLLRVRTNKLPQGGISFQKSVVLTQIKAVVH